MSESLVACCKKKSRLYKKRKKNPNAVNRVNYRLYAKTLKTTTREAEKLYYQTELNYGLLTCELREALEKW